MAMGSLVGAGVDHRGVLEDGARDQVRKQGTSGWTGNGVDDRQPEGGQEQSGDGLRVAHAQGSQEESADERTCGRHHEQSFPIEPIGQGSTEQRNRDHRKEFHQAEQAQCGVGIRDGKEVIGQHGGDQGASEEHAEACEEEDPNRRQCQNL